MVQLLTIKMKHKSALASLLLFLLLLLVHSPEVYSQATLFEVNPINFGQGITISSSDTLPGAWRQGQNPAGLVNSGLEDTGMVRFSSFVERGSYRQIHQPEELLYGLFTAKGAQTIDEWKVNGSIDLSRGINTNQNFYSRAPRQNHNPYQWVDTTGGDWTNNLVALSGAVGSPLLRDRINLGLSASYDVMQGARENNERPLFNYSKYSLTTGLLYQINNHSEAGFSFTYGSTNEEQEIGFFNQLDTFVLLLRGIGTFNQTSFNSASRTYQGTLSGVNAQYVRSTNSGLLSLSAGYSFYSEDISTGISRPTPTGQWELHTINSANIFRMQGLRIYHEFILDGSAMIGNGTDPVLNGINVELSVLRAELGYNLVEPDRGRRYKFRAGFVHYAKDDIVSLASQSYSLMNLDTRITYPLFGPSFKFDAGLGLQIPLDYSLIFRNQNEVISRFFIPQASFIDETTLSSDIHFYYTWRLSSYSLAAGLKLYHNTAPQSAGTLQENSRGFAGLHLTILY